MAYTGVLDITSRTERGRSRRYQPVTTGSEDPNSPTSTTTTTTTATPITTMTLACIKHPLVIGATLLYAFVTITMVRSVDEGYIPPMEQPRYTLYYFQDAEQMARCLDGSQPGEGETA